MKPGYTEFSFGYAFTENLIRSAATGTTGAPVFPNLVQEATLGYDVRIDFPAVPLFFQFKLPELMVRRSAVEIRKHRLPGLEVPFYRMPLMRRDLSQQHSYLIDLEKKFPQAVFYASPALSDLSRFNSAYSSCKVHEETRFFSPNSIGPLPDDKIHSVVYSRNKNCWFCSEPRILDGLTYQDIAKNLKLLLLAPRFISLEAVAKQTSQSIVEAIKHRRTRDFREGFAVEIDALEGPLELLDQGSLLPEIEEDFEPRESVSVDEMEAEIRKQVRQRRKQRDRSTSADGPLEPILEELLVGRELARIGLGMEVLVAQPHE